MRAIPPQSREELDDLERKHAENPEGRYFVPLANALREAGEFQRAKALLREGLDRYPDYVSAHIVLGRCLQDEGSRGEAEFRFRHVLTLDPQNLVALRTLGEIASLAGRTEEARGWFRELLSVDPMSEEARLGIENLPREATSSGDGAGLRVDDAPAPSFLGDRDPDQEAREGFPFVPTTADERVTGNPDETQSGRQQESGEPSREGDDADEADEGQGWGAPIVETSGEAKSSQDDEPSSGAMADGSEEVVVEERSPLIAEMAGADGPMLMADAVGGEERMGGREAVSTPGSGGEAFPAHAASADGGSPPAGADLNHPGDGDPAGGHGTDAERMEPSAGSDRLREGEVRFGVAETLRDLDRSTLPAPEDLYDTEEALATETLAELYTRQGFYDRAARVYRELIRRRGSEVRLRRSLERVERLAAGLPDKEDDPFADSFEAGFPGAPVADTVGTAAASPDGEAGEAAGPRPSIREYLRGVLAWSPGTPSHDVAEVDGEAVDASGNRQEEDPAGRGGSSVTADTEAGSGPSTAGTLETGGWPHETGDYDPSGATAFGGESEGRQSAEGDGPGSGVVRQPGDDDLFPWEVPPASSGTSAGDAQDLADAEEEVGGVPHETPTGSDEPSASLGSDSDAAGNDADVTTDDANADDQSSVEQDDDDLESFQAWLRSLKR